MSDVFTSTCNGIVDLLTGHPLLGGTPVIPEYQQDIVTEARKVATKTIGNLILVTEAGGENKQPEKDTVKLNGLFNVTLWSPLVTTPDRANANALKQALCQILHNHRPVTNGQEAHFNDRWIVMGCVRIAADEGLPLLVHRIPVQIPIFIPKLPAS